MILRHARPAFSDTEITHWYKKLIYAKCSTWSWL